MRLFGKAPASCAPVPVYPTRLLDHLIGQEEQRWRHRDPQYLGGLQVNDQLELRRLLHRQVGGLGTLQDLVHIRRPAPVPVRRARPLADEAAGLHILPCLVHGQQVAHGRECRELSAVLKEYGVPRRGAHPRAHWSWPRRRGQTRRDRALPRGAAGRPPPGPPRPPRAP
jgi:hypothetical protein